MQPHTNISIWGDNAFTRIKQIYKQNSKFLEHNANVTLTKTCFC